MQTAEFQGLRKRHVAKQFREVNTIVFLHLTHCYALCVRLCLVTKRFKQLLTLKTKARVHQNHSASCFTKFAPAPSLQWLVLTLRALLRT